MTGYTNPLAEYSPQMEAAEPPLDVLQFHGDMTPEVLSEGEEMDLASQFLEVMNEEELDEFLGHLIDRTGQALHETIEPPIEEDLGDILKSVAKAALPIAGKLLGGYFGGPAGAAIGGTIASKAGQLFGLELEGLSPEDSEFEVGKQFVRFATATVRNAIEASPGGCPGHLAHDAALEAARVHAPGLMDIGKRGFDLVNSAHRNCNCKGDLPVHNLDRTSVDWSPNSLEPGLNEENRMDLAAQLMEVGSEEEFENFLSHLIARGTEALGKFLNPSTSQALGGMLKDAAAQFLPLAGEAEPTNQSEAEADEQEWEAANIFVNVAVDAVGDAAEAPMGIRPVVVARNAVSRSARHHAPHLFAGFPAHEHDRHGIGHQQQESGNWARHGRKIILYGA